MGTEAATGMAIGTAGMGTAMGTEATATGIVGTEATATGTEATGMAMVGTGHNLSWWSSRRAVTTDLITRRRF